MDMTTGTLTLIIFAAIALQLIVLMLIGLRRRLCGEARPAHAKTVAKTTNTGWEGFREFIVERREYEDAGQEVCSFYLVPADGQPLPPFKPGQFLTFRLEVDGTQEIIRCYSLSDRPRPDFYRVSIKRVPAPKNRPDLPPGLSSNHFHDQVQPGSRLWLRVPSGHFHLQEDEQLPVVLIGGGIGITPMLSIVNVLLQEGSKREIWLYYGIRNGSEHVMKQRLQQLAAQHANFHLHVCYSAPAPDDREGGDYQHTGRIDIPLLRNTLKLQRYQFYVCGPAPLMECLVPGLEEWGVDSRDIYFEAFGPSTLKGSASTKDYGAVTGPVTVSFSRSDRKISWDPSAGSLLEFAEANGIEVMSGCRSGSCGSCQTEVIAGEVDYNQQPDADVESGHCLLCISRPKSDLILVE